MSVKSIKDHIVLSDGQNAPVLGFGLYLSPPDQSEASVLAALNAGYRHIDTADYYENGAAVGRAVKKSNLPRRDIFVSTKWLAPAQEDFHFHSACRKVVQDTGLDYVDCFLIHSPSPGSAVRRRFWEALEELQKEGLTKSIGTANFGVKHLQELKSYAKSQPTINQIELHPFMQQRDIVEYCQRNNIALEAYAPLVRGEKLSDPVLLRIAERANKSVAQILLRWSLQKGYMPLPKSDNTERIASNADLYDFELSTAQMKEIDELGQRNPLTLAPDNTRCP